MRDATNSPKDVTNGPRKERVVAGSLTVNSEITIRRGKMCLLNPRVATISVNVPPISSIIIASSPGRLTVACRETRVSSRLAGAGLARSFLMSAVAPVMAVLIDAMFDLYVALTAAVSWPAVWGFKVAEVASE